MRNAKTEFMEQIKYHGNPVCAKVMVARFYKTINCMILQEGYSEQEYDNFIKSLDFDYDSGYGGQELFGIILFKDSYSDRGEYDGSEWWANHKMPTPQEVMNFKVDE